jgi:antitoxin ParD1/3/4
MQLAFPPEIEAFIQRQLKSGKYRNLMDLILTAIELLQQQEDVYRGRLLELQQDAQIGWEASQKGQVVDGRIAMDRIRADLRERYGSSDV